MYGQAHPARLDQRRPACGCPSSPHAWQVFEEDGFEQTLVSPAGGPTPLEPRSLKFPSYDKSGGGIYFTGGHAVMYDFPDSEGLQRITREIFERGGIVASVCHGYCGLLTKLSDDSYLVAGRRLTRFAWQEEVLAPVDKLVPYNVDEEMKKRGALYEEGQAAGHLLHVVDGSLVTGQNPGSAKETAEKVAAVL